jgi:hypothetical protein
MKFAYFNPTVMAVADVPADTFANLKNIVDTAHTKTELNDSGNPAISIRGGQQIQLLPNEFNLDIGIIKRYVEAQCQEYLDAQIKQSGRNDLSAFQPVLVSAWTIRQTAGDYQALHSHEAHISGNIYIDVPDLDLTDNVSDAVIEFRLPVVRNPAHFVFVDQWRFTPNPMKMIIFPSYIPHTVYPWKGRGYRTILAWDVKLVAKKI